MAPRVCLPLLLTLAVFCRIGARVGSPGSLLLSVNPKFTSTAQRWILDINYRSVFVEAAGEKNVLHFPDQRCPAEI